MGNETKRRADEFTGGGVKAIGLTGATTWRMRALAFFIGGGAVFLVGLTGDPSAKADTTGLVAVGSFCLVWAALIATVAAARNWHGWPEVFSEALSIVLLALAVYFSRDEPSGVVVVVFVTGLYCASLSAWQRAVPYLVACEILIVGGLLIGDRAHETLQALATGAVAAYTMFTLSRAQHRMRVFARINRRLTYTDPLTGLANAGKLEGELSRFCRAPGAGRPTLMVLDLDNFKQVNDLYGHADGDRVLRAVADALNETTRSGDLVARRGGDEFAILTNPLAAIEVAAYTARLKQAVADARALACPGLEASVSIGAVHYEPGETSSDFLDRADTALHEAKLRSREGDATSGRMPGGVDYRSAGSEHDVDEEARAERWSASFLTWSGAAPFAAELWAFLTVTFALLLVTGLAPSLGAPLALTGLGAMAAVAAGFKAAARKSLSGRTFALIYFAGCAALTICLAGAGPERFALLDAYIPVAIWSIYYFTLKRGAPLLLLIAAAYASQLLLTDSPETVSRLAITVGAMIGAVLMVGSASLSAQRNSARFVRLSQIDQLTGAANMRGMRRRIARELANSAGQGMLTHISIDLEGFKAVNDTYSHSVGDRTLRDITAALKRVTGRGALVVRRGGDEFSVLLRTHDHGVEGIDRICASITEAIQLARLAICPDLPAGCSIAYVTHEPGESADHFFERSDTALHEVKTAGKPTAVTA